LLAHCDGDVRVGGASSGADETVATARTLGLRVFEDPADFPDASP